MIVLIHTDLPEPVVPAINRCGIELKSPISGAPDIFFPNAIGNLISFFLKSGVSVSYTHLRAHETS